MADRSTSHWPITLTHGAAAVFNLMLPLVLVRVLTPDQVGRYKIFFLYVMLSPGLFLVAGLSNGLYHWMGQYPQTKPEIRQSWSLMLMTTLALSGLAFLIAPVVAPALQITLHDLRLLLVAVPMIIGAAFLEDLLIARGSIWTGSFYASGFHVVKALAIVAVAVITRSVEYVIYAFLATIAIRTFIGWRLVAPSGEINWSFSWPQVRKVMKYAFPVSVAAMAALAIQNVDQMILSSRLAAAQFAVYAMGCLNLQPLHIFEISVNRVLIPRLSRALSTETAGHAAGLFSDAVAELYRYLLPSVIGLIIFAEPIVHILFTERYGGAAVYLRWYALSYLFLALPFDALARARADGGWILRTYIGFSALSIAGTWWAAGHWGAMGALLAVLAAQAGMRFYTLVYVRQWLSLPLTQFLPLEEIGIQTLLALSSGVVALFMQPLFADDRFWFLAAGSVFSLLYLGGTYVTYLQRHVRFAKPIRVLELAQTISLGGLERMIYVLSQQLRQNSHFQVLVATYDHASAEPSLAAQFEQAGVRLVQWQKGNGFSLMSVLRLVRIIVTERIRVLHVHNLGPLVYGSLAKVLSLGHVRLVLTLHSTTDLDRSRRYAFYFKFFLRFADRIIAVSPTLETRLLALGVRPQRIEVIPNGVFFAKSPALNGNQDGRKTMREQLAPQLSPALYGARWMLCLARLHPGKGQDVVLNLWAALPAQVRSRLVLFFVGQETQAGHRAWLEEKIRAVPDRDRVVIVGPSNDPHRWIESSDMFISGSLQEGMPLAPLEAAGSGLPTILSDIEGHHFLKSWAQYFDPRNPGEGAQRIVDILETLERDQRSVQVRWDAASTLRERWSAPAMTAQYAEAFESA